MEKKRLEADCEAAAGRYRATVNALEGEVDPGAVRRAIRVANQAWAAHSEACQSLNDHIVAHGCGQPQPVRRRSGSHRQPPFQ